MIWARSDATEIANTKVIGMGRRTHPENFGRFVGRFIRNDSGATAIEYGLIASLVSVAVISAATTLGKNVSSTFKVVSNTMTAK